MPEGSCRLDGNDTAGHRRTASAIRPAAGAVRPAVDVVAGRLRAGRVPEAGSTPVASGRSGGVVVLRRPEPGDRRRKDRESTPPSTGWFIEPEIDGLDADRAVECLGRLPDDVREVIVARIWGGLSFEQIATVAGCSASTAYRRFESGIVTLREILGVPCPNRPN
jgi:Sigma-70, region 4